jgi:hypothetical protein
MRQNKAFATLLFVVILAEAKKAPSVAPLRAPIENPAL